jgi:Raf kinase inhibitor-like YbhB/YbcL family protein
MILVGLGCGSSERKLASNTELSGGLSSLGVSCTAFRDGEAIPRKYTADGENVSPPLRWSGGPTGTKEFVVIVEDPDADNDMPAMHWMVYRMPASVRELPEGASASDGQLVQGRNHTGQTGYAGPNPPKGNRHRYFFQVFALDQSLDLPAGATRAELGKSLERGAIAKGELIGTYQR